MSFVSNPVHRSHFPSVTKNMTYFRSHPLKVLWWVPFLEGVKQDTGCLESSKWGMRRGSLLKSQEQEDEGLSNRGACSQRMGFLVCRGEALGAWEKVPPPGHRPREESEAAAWPLLLISRCRLLPAAVGWREKGGNKLAGPWPRSNKRLVCHPHIVLPCQPPSPQSTIATRAKTGSGLPVQNLLLEYRVGTENVCSCAVLTENVPFGEAEEGRGKCLWGNQCPKCCECMNFSFFTSTVPGQDTLGLTEVPLHILNFTEVSGNTHSTLGASARLLLTTCQPGPGTSRRGSKSLDKYMWSMPWPFLRKNSSFS